MLTHKTSRFVIFYFPSFSRSLSFSLSLSLSSYSSICVGSNTCEAGYKAYDGDGDVKNRQCLGPCPGGGERNLHDGLCNEAVWTQVLKVVGILVGTASLALVVFKAHLFVKLRHQDRLLPGYRGPSGFYTVFAYGTKGNHVKPSKSQTPVALGRAGDLSASLIAGDGLNIQDAGERPTFAIQPQHSTKYCGSCGAVAVDSEAQFCDDCGGSFVDMGGEGKYVYDKGIEMSESVRNFYAVNKLEHVCEQITALGVKSTDDLMFLEESDLTEAGLPRVDMRRFKAGVQNMRDAAANDAAATTAAPDVEQKNDQEDTVIIDNDTSSASAAEEKAEEKNTQDDADTVRVAADATEE